MNTEGLRNLDSGCRDASEGYAAQLVVQRSTRESVPTYSHEGIEQWRLELRTPESRGSYGSASSPILIDDLVVQTVDTKGGNSRIIGVDREDGTVRWEAPRPLFSASWSTPVILKSEGQRDLIVLGSKKLVAYDPASGKERWSASGFPAEAVAVPAVGSNRVFAGGAGRGGRSNLQFEGLRWANVAEFDKDSDGALEKSEIPEGHRGVQRPELPEGHPGRRLPWPLRSMLDGMDENKDGKVTETEWTSSLTKFESRDRPVLMALKAGKATLSEEDRVAWSHGRGIPEIPSPLLYQGKLFLIRDGGLLQCLDADSGSLLYNERIGVSGAYCASPVAADGRVYLSSHSGTIVVVNGRANELEILARNALNESITATPAIVGDLLYVRTAQHLYAFSSGAEDGQGVASRRGPGAADAELAARN
jgi:outer membrane protein assembly factor BamB